MQVRTVTADFIFSNDCTFEMLKELALHKDFVALSEAAVEKLASQPLKNGSQKKGNKSHASGDMPFAKLRTIIVQKLQDSPQQGEVFKAGNMQFEFVHLQDVKEQDINAAGANKAKQGTSQRATSTELKGNYKVVKTNGLKATAETDPGKWTIWQHVWSCSSFEEYFSKAPKKAVTRTGRIITASSEMRWAVKCGWIVPVNNTAQQ